MYVAQYAVLYLILYSNLHLISGWVCICESSIEGVHHQAHVFTCIWISATQLSFICKEGKRKKVCSSGLRLLCSLFFSSSPSSACISLAQKRQSQRGFANSPPGHSVDRHWLAWDCERLIPMLTCNEPLSAEDFHNQIQNHLHLPDNLRSLWA